MLDKVESNIKDFAARSILNINSKFSLELYKILKEKAKLVENLNSMSKYQFVLEDNHKLQRVISSIFASSVVEGMIISNGKDMETKIYELNFETIIENLVFYDLYQQKYKLFPVVIDVLGESMLKDISLNYSRIIEKLKDIEKKNIEFKSLLRSRALLTL